MPVDLVSKVYSGCVLVFTRNIWTICKQKPLSTDSVQCFCVWLYVCMLMLMYYISCAFFCVCLFDLNKIQDTVDSCQSQHHYINSALKSECRKEKKREKKTKFVFRNSKNINNQTEYKEWAYYSVRCLSISWWRCSKHCA